MRSKFNIVTAPRRDSRHWKNGTISWDEILGWMVAPRTKKDSGSYVLGLLDKTEAKHSGNDKPCIGVHRRKQAVVSRSMLALDVDSPADDFLLSLAMLGVRLVWHTTHSSRPDKPRYRVLIPLDRDVDPGEYQLAVMAVMDRVGEESFDQGSTQPERYMFRPAAEHPDWFSWGEIQGPVAEADGLVSAAPDLSTLPVPAVPKAKQSPFDMPGVLGAFNRAYTDLDDLSKEYDLPYVSVGSDRWALAGTDSAAGMGAVTDGLWFSHHANDPAGGRAATAFDLVRTHRYGHLDDEAKPGTPINRMPSHLEMLKCAQSDVRVVMEVVGQDFGPAASQELAANDDDDDPQPAPPVDWRSGLQISSSGQIRDTIGNWDLISHHDSVLQSLRYNVFTLGMESDSDLPWRATDVHAGGPLFSENDRLALADYIERTYTIRPMRGRIDSLVAAQGAARRHDPVKSYLENLPEWDGRSRLEECLPGVRPTEYTRLVARKSMVAAVARVMDPGVKWDHSLVLYGDEGLGKSYWIDKMAQGFTATLGRVDQKDTLIVMHRSWIVVADEGHSMKKADADQLKEFLTRRHDVFRMPYDRQANEYPRRNVIWSTTNDEIFLRRQQGNRRFLIVHCQDKVDFSLLTDEYIDQVWAEAVAAYRGGELLFLEGEQAALAASERERFTEEDHTSGIAQEFLDMLVPADWDDLGPYGRQDWYRDHQQGMAQGVVQQERTCALQIWTEALGNDKGRAGKADLRQIHETLKELPGWRKLPGRHRVPGYGPQQTYERFDYKAELEELI
jgi:predicted P-loop ATPase